MTDLHQQIALVTGASRGIGQAIAIELARQGATVIGTATSAAGAESITAALAAIRPDCGRGAVLDVNNASACTALIDSMQKEFGGVSILVNNAGITADQLAMRMKEEEWDAVIATNLTAVGRLARAVLRGMMKAKAGRIINITSVVGSAGNAGQMNYAAAKAGVAGMSRALAREIGSRNITVNCIAPGFVRSNENTERQWEARGAQGQQSLLDAIALKRLGSPQDIAYGVLFFASEQAGWITGQTLAIDGGK